MLNQGGIGQSIHLKRLFKAASLVFVEPTQHANGTDSDKNDKNCKNYESSKPCVEKTEEGTIDLWISGCSCNPQEIKPGDAFFAIGSRKSSVTKPNEQTSYLKITDSLDFTASEDWNSENYACEDWGDVFFSKPYQTQLSDAELSEVIRIAIDRGCKVVVADRIVKGLSVPLLVVRDSEKSYGICVHALWGQPGKSLKLIGVSGTYGKTTTSYLIAGMLAEAGQSVGLIGSLGIFDGEKVYPTTQTTPPPDEIAYWLMRMVANGCSHAIIEISSQAIFESHLIGLQFDAICMTNIRCNHLNYHGTVESYRRTKLHILQFLKKKGFAVCNADDYVTAAVLPLIDHPVLTVSVHDSDDSGGGPCDDPDNNLCHRNTINSEVSGISIERNVGEQTFLVSAGNEAVALSTKMIGDENLYNCLMAAALGIGLEIDLRVAIRGIERVQSVPGRMERIDCGQPYNVFVDCAPTPESLAGSLRSLRKVVQGHLYCVLGIDEKSPSSLGYADSLPTLCRVLKNWTDAVIITNDELCPSKGSFDDSIMEKMSREMPGHSLQMIETRSDAIHHTLSHAEPGDCVLIVGRGGADFQRFLESDMLHLSDRTFVKHLLYEKQPGAVVFQ